MIWGDASTIDPRALRPVPTTPDWREVRVRDGDGAPVAPTPPVKNTGRDEDRPTGRDYHNAAKLREARKLARRNGMTRAWP
jgi:hypothetical protein